MSKETLKLARQLLWRYRHETPIGNQPYMICHAADEAFEKIDESLAQPEERNFCSRCGKRTADLTVIHTCTPPQQEQQGCYKRPWVGLAAEDRLTAKYMQDAPDGIEAVIDYIEAKLKQKNGYAEENT